MAKTVFVSDASTGVGRAAAERFAAAGWNVAAAMQTAGDSAPFPAASNIFVTSMDTADAGSVDAAVEAAVGRFSGIDVLVNSAGYRMYGLLEATSVESMRALFETNVIGMLATTRAVVAAMRKRQLGGVVVNLGSIAGMMTYPLSTFYSGTRFAVEGISEALRFELREIDVRVKLIVPGVILAGSKPVPTQFHNDASLVEYQGVVSKFTETMDDAAEVGTEAGACADVLYEAATDDTDQFRYLVGEDAHAYAATVAGLDPEGYFDNMSTVFGLIAPRVHDEDVEE